MCVLVVAKKLDPASRREWELHHGAEDAQTMDALTQFVEERAPALEFSAISPEKTTVKMSRDKDKTELQLNHNRSDGGKTCSKFSPDHGLYACEGFKTLSFDEKSVFVKEKGLCFNCLRSGHNSQYCKSRPALTTAPSIEWPKEQRFKRSKLFGSFGRHSAWF